MAAERAASETLAAKAAEAKKVKTEEVLVKMTSDAGGNVTKRGEEDYGVLSRQEALLCRGTHTSHQEALRKPSGAAVLRLQEALLHRGTEEALFRLGIPQDGPPSSSPPSSGPLSSSPPSNTSSPSSLPSSSPLRKQEKSPARSPPRAVLHKMGSPPREVLRKKSPMSSPVLSCPVLSCPVLSCPVLATPQLVGSVW